MVDNSSKLSDEEITSKLELLKLDSLQLMTKLGHVSPEFLLYQLSGADNSQDSKHQDEVLYYKYLLRSINNVKLYYSSLPVIFLCSLVTINVIIIVIVVIRLVLHFNRVILRLAKTNCSKDLLGGQLDGKVH